MAALLEENSQQMEELMATLLGDVCGPVAEPLQPLEEVAFPNALEQAVLECGEGHWFRTGSGCEGFTLSYGRFSYRVQDEDDDSPHTALPCCWRDCAADLFGQVPEVPDGKMEYVMFEGRHFAVVHSGRFSEISHCFVIGPGGSYHNPSKEDCYGSKLDNVISSDGTELIRKHMWKMYIGAPKLVDCLKPATYTTIMRPELYTALEAQFGLGGGEWYWLPSDCCSCT